MKSSDDFTTDIGPDSAYTIHQISSPQKQSTGRSGTYIDYTSNNAGDQQKTFYNTENPNIWRAVNKANHNATNDMIESMQTRNNVYREEARLRQINT